MDNSLEKILKNLSCHPLLERSLWNSKHYIFKLDTPSDFSGIDPFNMAAMIDKTEQLLQQHHTTIGIGRYNEKRELYQHPQYNNRCIHLGIDICTTAHTPLFAPINGIIHQIANHDMPGDYGPTIIIKHHVQQQTFYTLYGHLSLNSINQLHLNQHIQAGEKIGAIGSPQENGGWPPHCHFQIIKQLKEGENNFPGVCSEQERKKMLNLCPDPNLLLKRY